MVDGAGAENGGANAHIGGAESDGAGEIAAHTHAQLLDSKRLSKLGEQREMHCRLFLKRRNAHQPVDRKPKCLAAQRDEGLCLGGSNA